MPGTLLRSRPSILLLAVHTIWVLAILLMFPGGLLSQEPGVLHQVTAHPASPLVGQSVTFAAAIATPQIEVPQLREAAPPCRYLWEFGDGTSAVTAERETAHIYTTPGAFSAKASLQAEIGPQRTWSTIATSVPVLIVASSPVAAMRSGGADTSPSVPEPGPPPEGIPSSPGGVSEVTVPPAPYPGNPAGGNALPPVLPRVTIGSLDPSFSPQLRSLSLTMGHPATLSYTSEATNVQFLWSVEGAARIDQNGIVTPVHPGQGTVSVRGVITVAGTTYVVSDHITVYVSDLSVAVGQPWSFAGLPYIDLLWFTCPNAPTEYCRGMDDVSCYLATRGFPDCQTDDSGHLTHVSQDDTTGWWIARFFIDPTGVDAWAHWGADSYEGGRIDGYYAGMNPLWGMPVPDDVTSRILTRCVGYAPGCPCGGCGAPQVPIYVAASPPHDHGQVTWTIDGAEAVASVGGPIIRIEKDAQSSSPGYHAYRIRPVRSNYSGWVPLQARYQCGTAARTSPVQWVRYDARCPATTTPRTITLTAAFTNDPAFAGQTSATVVARQAQVTVSAAADVRLPDGNAVSTPLTYHWTLFSPDGQPVQRRTTAPTSTFLVEARGRHEIVCWASDADQNISNLATVVLTLVDVQVAVRPLASDYPFAARAVIAAGRNSGAICDWAQIRVTTNPPVGLPLLLRMHPSSSAGSQTIGRDGEFSEGDPATNRREIRFMTSPTDGTFITPFLSGDRIEDITVEVVYAGQAVGNAATVSQQWDRQPTDEQDDFSLSPAYLAGIPSEIAFRCHLENGIPIAGHPIRLIPRQITLGIVDYHLETGEPVADTPPTTVTYEWPPEDLPIGVKLSQLVDIRDYREPSPGLHKANVTIRRCFKAKSLDERPAVSEVIVRSCQFHAYDETVYGIR